MELKPAPFATSERWLSPGEAEALRRRTSPSSPHGAAGVSPCYPSAPAAAHPPGRQGTVSAGRRSPLLCGDHLLTVRRAVAETLPAHQPRLKARILAGEADHLPLMCAGFAVAERLLEGMFS